MIVRFSSSTENEACGRVDFFQLKSGEFERNGELAVSAIGTPAKATKNA